MICFAAVIIRGIASADVLPGGVSEGNPDGSAESAMSGIPGVGVADPPVTADGTAHPITTKAITAMAGKAILFTILVLLSSEFFLTSELENKALPCFFSVLFLLFFFFCFFSDGKGKLDTTFISNLPFPP